MASISVSQFHLGQYLTVVNDRGGQFYGQVRGLIPGGVIMDVVQQLDDGKWIRLRKPELRTIPGAIIVEDE